MGMRRVTKIDSISAGRRPHHARQNGFWWVLLFIWVACLLTAGDQGWALDNTSLNGTYVIHDFQSAFGGVDANGGWGVSDSVGFSRTEVTFNGAGGWSGKSTNYELERQISEIVKNMGGDQALSDKFNVLVPTPDSETISGKYMVNRDGTGNITHDEGTEPLFVSADGSIVLLGKREYYSANHYAWLSMGLGVKKGSGLSAASLNGTYVIHDLQSAFGGMDSNGGWGVSDSASFGRIEVTFNGAGAWSGASITYELERQMTEIVKDMGGDQVLSNKFKVDAPTAFSEPTSGMYTVSSDGTGTVTHSEGTEPLFVSADGSVILLGKREYESTNRYAWVSMAVGVKKGGGLSAANLKGTYVIHDLQYAFSGVDANGGWGASDSVGFSRTEVTFNGAGAFRGKSTNFELERQITEIVKNIGDDQVLSNKFTVLVPTPGSEAISGEYTVNSDGTGTITHGEGTETFFVSADGSIILLGNREYSSTNHHAWVSMGIGVKKTFTPKGMPWMQLLTDE
jgi:hypothetical protein